MLLKNKFFQVQIAVQFFPAMQNKRGKYSQTKNTKENAPPPVLLSDWGDICPK
jgi:hypothetical protein